MSEIRARDLPRGSVVAVNGAVFLKLLSSGSRPWQVTGSDRLIQDDVVDDFLLGDGATVLRYGERPEESGVTGNE